MPIYESAVRRLGKQRIRTSAHRTAEDVLTKGLRPSPEGGTFDVFLSHSIDDAELVLGVVELLEDQSLTVYVDWLIDPHLNRSNVTRETADRLRNRMQSCKSLIFATSASSPSSKWMPWELGYFDGLRGQRVAILPLADDLGSTRGQEYLELYPRVEAISVGNSWSLAATRGTFHREWVTLHGLAAGEPLRAM